ncbi:unnamed protein product, partial [Cyprideis torosa]
FLEVQASGRRKEFRLLYVTSANKPAFVTFQDIVLDDGGWHQISLTLSGSEVSLYLNCSLVHSRVLHAPALSELKTFMQGSSVHLGSRDGKHFGFKVQWIDKWT